MATTMNEEDYERFVQRAKKVHPELFDDYSRIREPCDDQNRVNIVCKVHGLYTQRIKNHLLGHRCFKCKPTTNPSMANDDFIQRAQKVHGDKFDYSQTTVERSSIKVAIGCHKHGVFMQTPNHHLGGNGCPKCRNENNAIRKAHTFEAFVEKANACHNGKYKYTKEDYKIGRTQKTRIICPIDEHGPFYQTNSSHLRGRGCPKCGRKLRPLKLWWEERKESESKSEESEQDHGEETQEAK